jgi:hypothetical protein
MDNLIELPVAEGRVSAILAICNTISLEVVPIDPHCF